MRKLMTGLLLAAACVGSAAPGAQARDGIGAGGAAALGVLGGVVAGSAIANAQNGYYPGQPVYRAPPPVVVEEEVCHVERRVSVDRFGDEHIRRVRVCE